MEDTFHKAVSKARKFDSSNTKYAAVNKRGVVATRKVKITAYATDGSSKKRTITIKIK